MASLAETLPGCNGGSDLVGLTSGDVHVGPVHEWHQVASCIGALPRLDNNGALDCGDGRDRSPGGAKQRVEQTFCVGFTQHDGNQG